MKSLEIYTLENFIAKNDDNIILGSFESFHIGHFKVFEETLQYSGRKILFVFNQETFEFKNKGEFFQSNIASYFNLAQLNLDLIVEIDFRSIKNLSAFEFIKKISHNQNVKIFAGEDFKLGNDLLKLKEINLEDLNISCITVPIFKVNNTKISTRFLKEMIEFGDVKTANELLVFNFTINGIFEEGKILFNAKQLLPHKGFYVAKLYINNLIYFSLIHINANKEIRWYSIDKEFEFLNKINNTNCYIEFIDKIYLVTSKFDDILKEEYKAIAKKIILVNEKNNLNDIIKQL
ncbi:hypothetical protein MCANUF31_03355 [Mycoplasmopsis canis UF31]|uniref:FAD synthase n=1 Tax=Mycoplasmopsis canis TaxID=29555 RepID=UPI00025ADC58|nr:hypothetical protein [Mycoplasmopsis canis]EIE39704.1 hypothetical protein MCANUF31_03355 [Mycoplasmopsis canis UF31]